MTGAAWWFLACWIALLGGMIGSFLNVVVYRLPRRKNLAYPGSACPACGRAIRPWHNIPVFGWLMLRGRCYDCQAAISPRYPLVEGVTALVFVAAAITGPLADGAAWPHQPEEASGLSGAALWLVFAYQMLLVCTLQCSTLIEYDGGLVAPGETWRFPWKLFLAPLAIGLVAPMFLPALHPVHASQRGAAMVNEAPLLVGLADGLAGGLIGGLMGLCAWPATGSAALRGRGRWTAAASAALVGVFLGWQAAAALVLAATFLYFFVVFASLAYPHVRNFPWSMLLFQLTALWVVIWNPLFERFPLLGAASDAKLGLALLVAGVSVLSTSFWIWVLSRRWK